MKTDTNLKALYILVVFLQNVISKAICSDCTDFCLQIFVYNCVFRKKEKNDKTFDILKMKTPSFNNFENAPSKRISLYCALVSGFSENANNVADAHRDAQTNR